MKHVPGEIARARLPADAARLEFGEPRGRSEGGADLAATAASTAALLGELTTTVAERRRAAQRKHDLIARLRAARVPWRRIAFAVRRAHGARDQHADAGMLGERLRKQHERWRTRRPANASSDPGLQPMPVAGLSTEVTMPKQLIKETTTTTTKEYAEDEPELDAVDDDDDDCDDDDKADERQPRSRRGR